MTFLNHLFICIYPTRLNNVSNSLTGFVLVSFYNGSFNVPHGAQNVQCYPVQRNMVVKLTNEQVCCIFFLFMFRVRLIMSNKSSR